MAVSRNIFYMFDAVEKEIFNKISFIPILMLSMNFNHMAAFIKNVDQNSMLININFGMTIHSFGKVKFTRNNKKIFD